MMVTPDFRASPFYLGIHDSHNMRGADGGVRNDCDALLVIVCGVVRFLLSLCR